MTGTSTRKKPADLIVSVVFIVSLGVILWLRYRSMGSGITGFPDEYRYFNTVAAVKALFQGNVAEFARLLSTTQGRPGDAFFRLIAAVGQAVLFKTKGLNTGAPESLIVGVWMNFVVLLANAALFYSLGKKFFSSTVALVLVVLYSACINTNIYLRHVLPYDGAVLFLLLALNFTTSYLQSPRKALWFVVPGLCAGACHTVYPGCFASVFALGLFIVVFPLNWVGNLKQLLPNIFRAAAYTVGLVIVLGFFEVLARIGGVSYLMASQELSGNINQGDFSEAFSFLFEYLVYVEKELGIILLALLVVAAFVGLRQRAAATPVSSMLATLFGCFVVGWAVYASLGYFLHKLVFYGRIVHQFYVPIVLLAGVGLGWLLDAVRGRAALVAGVLMALLVAKMVVFYQEYQQVQYPKDVAYKLGLTNDCDSKMMLPNSVCGKKGGYSGLFQMQTNHPSTCQTNYRLFNFGVLYPVECFDKNPDYAAACKVVSKTPYAFAFNPYLYESYNATERALFRNNQVFFVIAECSPAAAIR